MKLGLKRIFLGGLVAGLALAIGGVLSAFILGLGDTFTAQGVALDLNTALLQTGLRFGLGFAAIFLFAGMRRGLGRTPLTALLTATLVWYAAYVPGTVALRQLSIYDDRQLSAGLIWGFAEMTVALLLGAWFFRDEAPVTREPMAKAPVEVTGTAVAEVDSGGAVADSGEAGADAARVGSGEDADTHPDATSAAAGADTSEGGDDRRGASSSEEGAADGDVRGSEPVKGR